MRGKAIFVVEMVYLAVLTAMVLLIFKLAEDKASWEIGQLIFKWLNYVQLLTLFIVSPTITASAITLEREQKTYDILLTTPLSPWQIIWNKLLASLSYFFVLIIMGLPYLGLCFILGGISPLEVALSIMLAFGSTMLAGVLGLYISTISQRTTVSAPLSSVQVIAILIVTSVMGNSYPALATVNPLISSRLLVSNWVVPLFGGQIPFWMPYFIFTALIISWGLSAAVENIKLEDKRNLKLRQGIALTIIFIALACILGANYNINSSIKEIKDNINNYSQAFLLLSSLIAATAGSGRLARKDFQILGRSWRENSLILENWLGGYTLQGTRLSILISIMGTAILGAGLIFLPLQRKSPLLFLSLGVILSFGTAVSLAGRYFSLNKRFQGKHLPGLITIIILSCLITAPSIISSAFHGGNAQTAVKSLPADAVLFLSPSVALSATVNPVDTLNQYPYCKQVLGDMDFAMITMAIYGFFIIVLLLLNIRQEKKINCLP